MNINGQTRTIIGRVISEDFEPLPGLDIENSNNVLLGKTDMDGRFKFNIPTETDSLLFRYVGMEWTDIRLNKDCNIVEVAIMYDVLYDFITLKKVDRLRKKRFNKLKEIHSTAFEKGLFKMEKSCVIREFETIK